LITWKALFFFPIFHVPHFYIKTLQTLLYCHSERAVERRRIQPGRTIFIYNTDRHCFVDFQRVSSSNWHFKAQRLLSVATGLTFRNSAYLPSPIPECVYVFYVFLTAHSNYICTHHGPAVYVMKTTSLYRKVRAVFTYLLHGAKSFLRNWPVFATSQEIPRIFMEPESSLPYSQVPARPYLEPIELYL
jgi:hypothetical protein